MKIKRLKIKRLPGINQTFEIQMPEAGICVIFGPNGIGKSSICRAVEALYWENCGPSQRISVIGEFELDGENWLGTREGSGVRWQRAGDVSVPPNLPPYHSRQFFFLRLRNLIDPSPDITKNIASVIHRQMSGGFDLDQIASDLFRDVTRPRCRVARNSFNKAKNEVETAEIQQSHLQRRVDKLESLRAQLDKEKSSAGRLTFVKRALGLAGRRQNLAELKRKMAAMPNALSKVTGKEVEQVQQLQSKADSYAERARSIKEKLEQTKELRQNSQLSAPLDKAELATWRNNADELSRVEVKLGAAEIEHSACRQEFAAALSAVGDSSLDEVKLNLTAHSQLFEFLRSCTKHDDRSNAIEERLRLLRRVDELGDRQGDLDQYRDATSLLRSWLRVPEAETLREKIRERRYWVLSAFILTVSGFILAMLVDPTFGMLAAVGVGVSLPVFLLRNQKLASSDRKTYQSAFEKLSVSEPDLWDIPSVESRLHSLENETANLQAAFQRARDRDVERQSLINELAGMSQQKDDLENQRQKLRDSLGIDLSLPDAELVDAARGLDQLRTARQKYEAAAGKVECLKVRHANLLTNLSDILTHFGEQPPSDAATAQARLNQLTDRNRQLEDAADNEEKLNAQLNQIFSDRDETRDSIRKIYTDLEFGETDIQALRKLVDLLPDYLELKQNSAFLEGQIELDRSELNEVGESELLTSDKSSLEQLIEECSQSVEEEARLRDEIAEIKAQADEAKHSQSVHDLIAMREQARTKLSDVREEALFAKAGQFLINAVKKEYEQTQMPRVFERARSHFSFFTNQSYELHLGKGEGTDGHRLFAIDLRRNRGRQLSQLSDGTRSQLLLAARLAFAEEVEHGKILPLFLDEALDQSDPVRFEAIMGSLGRIAMKQGRQIFYLTCDHLDVDRIQHALSKEKCEIASAIDLGLIRRNEASVSGPDILHVDTKQAVPTPDGLAAAEYGASLGVPEFWPSLGSEEQHFFYVLSDDLELLYDFLVNGIKWAGQWKIVSDTPLADRLCSRSISASEISLRLSLLHSFCELWKHGRGRPVDHDAIKNSGAVTARYLVDVVAVAEDLAGDAEKLISALKVKKDTRLKGFRQNNCEKLEKFLRDNGYLDEKPIFSENELRLRALATPAANQLPQGVASECLNRWWNWFANDPGHEQQE